MINRGGGGGGDRRLRSSRLSTPLYLFIASSLVNTLGPGSKCDIAFARIVIVYCKLF